MGEIVIYETEGRAVEVRLDGDTIWLTQRQMSQLLDTSTDNIGLHINKIYEDDELSESATTEEYSVVQKEGSRRNRQSDACHPLSARSSGGSTRRR